MAGGVPRDAPKRVWMYWHQGWSSSSRSLPKVVAAAAASWARWNPGWEVIKLEPENLSRYLDLEQVRRAGGPN